MSKDNVRLVGTVTDFKFSHNCKGHDIYEGIIDIKRRSGTIDSIRFLTVDNNITGLKRIGIEGRIRTYSYVGQDNKLHKMIVVMASKIMDCPDLEDENTVKIDGVIVKTLPTRETPLGKKICDFVIATNYNFKKSAYINAIAWGNAGEKVSEMKVGDRKVFYGRLQSRRYTKIRERKFVELHTAYEFSMARFEDIEDDTCCN